jgi:cytochrome c5
MKSKIIAVAALFVVFCSCSSKKVVATTVPKEEPNTIVLTEKLAEGKTLYENSCVRCHQLHAATEFNKEEWKRILTKMQPKAHLDNTQIASISDYITSQL